MLTKAKLFTRAHVNKVSGESVHRLAAFFLRYYAPVEKVEFKQFQERNCAPINTEQSGKPLLKRGK